MNVVPNKSPVDLFTISHLGSGVFLGQFAPLPVVAAGAIAFEVIERHAKKAFGQFFRVRGQDTIVNSAVDVVAVVLGAYLSQRAHEPYWRKGGEWPRLS